MDEAIFHYRGSRDFSESVVDILEIQSNFMLSTAERKFSRTSALFRNRLLSHSKARRALLRFDIQIDSDCPNSWIFHTDIVPFRLVFPCCISTRLLPLVIFITGDLFIWCASGNGAETIDNTRRICFAFSLRLTNTIYICGIQQNLASILVFADALNIIHFRARLKDPSGIQIKYLMKNLLCCRKTKRRCAM